MPQNKKISQQILLNDGSYLQGEALSLEGEILSWRHPDLSSPLMIPLKSIIRAELGKPNPKPDQATIKFVTGSWVTASIESIDGSKIRCSIDGKSVVLQRKQIDWIGFPRPGLTTPVCFDGLTPFWKSGDYKWGIWQWTPEGLKIRSAVFMRSKINDPGDIFKLDLHLSQNDEVFCYLFLSDKGLEGSFQLRYDQKFRKYDESSPLPGARFGNSDEEPDSEKTFKYHFDRQLLNELAKAEGRDKSWQEDEAKEKVKKAGRHWQMFVHRRRAQVLFFCNGRKMGEWNLPSMEPPVGDRVSISTEKGETHVKRFFMEPWDGETLPGQTQQPRVIAEGLNETEGVLQSLDRSHAVIVGSQGKQKIPRSQLELIFFGNPAREVEQKERLLFNLANWGSLYTTQADEHETYQTDVPVALDNLVRIAQGCSPHCLGNEPYTDKAHAITEKYDLLTLRNGDRLAGRLRNIDEQLQVDWSSAGENRKLAVTPENAVHVLLQNPPQQPEATKGLFEVELKNGDSLLGRLVSYDARILTLETTHGTCQLSQDSLQSIRSYSLAYSELIAPWRDPRTGELREDGIIGDVWQKKEYLWEEDFDRKTDYTERRDRVLHLIEGDSAWFRKQLPHLDDQFVIRFSMFNPGRTRMFLYHCVHDEHRPDNIFDYTFKSEVPDNRIELDAQMFFDLRQRKVIIVCNDEITDEQPITGLYPDHLWLRFGTDAAAGGSHVILPLLQTWKGAAPTLDCNENIWHIALTNGDSMSCQVLAANKEFLTIKSAFGEGKVSLEKLAELTGTFKQKPSERKTRFPAGTGIRFHDGCRLTLRNMTLDGDFIKGKHEKIGQCKIPREQVREIVLQPREIKIEQF